MIESAASDGHRDQRLPSRPLLQGRVRHSGIRVMIVGPVMDSDTVTVSITDPAIQGTDSDVCRGPRPLIRRTPQCVSRPLYGGVSRRVRIHSAQPPQPARAAPAPKRCQLQPTAIGYSSVAGVMTRPGVVEWAGPCQATPSSSMQ